MDPRYLLFQSKVDARSVHRILKSYDNATNIEGVYVDSLGGQIMPAFDAIPAFRKRGMTMLAGDVGSMAVQLFLTADVRQGTEESRFRFHQITRRSGEEQQISLREMQASIWYAEQMGFIVPPNDSRDIEIMRILQERNIQFIAGRMDVDPATVYNLMVDEVELGIGDARRLNIVNQVIGEPFHLVW